MEKLVTLAMPEHDISQDVEKPFAGESHFLWDNYTILLSHKEEANNFPQRRKAAKILCLLGVLTSLREIIAT